MGIDVACVDVDQTKIDRLNAGGIPIYEPGLEEMVARNRQAGRLRFTTSLAEVLPEADLVFCAVGTPPDEDGSADLKYVLEVARTVGREMNRYTVVVTKSTVPVGTSRQVKRVIEEELERRGVHVEFDVASNPEFLKEGAAIEDFMNPDRVVVGVDSERARKLLSELYDPFRLRPEQLLFTDVASAEMIKYAANSMLATRISFMNDIANLCALLGADVNMVRRGIGSDTRIGSKFLYPGCGYGGSCFPKDVKALIRMGERNGYRMRVLEAVEEVNERQKGILFDKLCGRWGGRMSGRTVALWGLAFKPQTDDMREAPALVLIDKLLEVGCRVQVYDPVAMDECRRRIGNRVCYCDNMYAAAKGADALMLVTEWHEFRTPDFSRLVGQMRTPLLLDGRNIYDRQVVEQAGFVYDAI